MINLTAQINESNVQDFDEDTKRRVEIISNTPIRKGDEMEVARTKAKEGNIFLNAYLELLSENGLNLRNYRAKNFTAEMMIIIN